MIASMRALLARAARSLTTLGVALQFLLLGAWIASRLASDATYPTQYLYWIPAPAYIVAAFLLAPAGWVLARTFSRRVLGVLALTTPLLITAYTLAVEWRVLRSRPETHDQPYRVVHWNCSYNPGNVWTQRLIELDPNLVVINPASFQPWEAILAHYRGGGILFREGFAVLSKQRLRAFAVISLNINPGIGIDPRTPDGITSRVDRGRAVFLELEPPPGLSRPLVVWIIDLPSDLSLWRMRVARQAAQTIRDFAGPIVRLDPQGRPSAEPWDAKGFPPPDLILGDMNTPRGSASLREIVGSMPHAFDAAGRGPAWTWPARFPITHLDHIFVSARFRPIDYQILDLGGGTHRAQLADVLLESTSPER